MTKTATPLVPFLVLFIAASFTAFWSHFSDQFRLDSKIDLLDSFMKIDLKIVDIGSTKPQSLEVWV